jgi:adhesin/invasin
MKFRTFVAWCGAIALTTSGSYGVFAGQDGFGERFFFGNGNQPFARSFVDTLTDRSFGASSMANAYAAGRTADPASALASMGSQAIRQYLLPSLGAEAPEWAKRFEFEFDLQKDLKPTYSILTVQPLYQDAEKQNTIFVQASLLRYELLGKYRDTTNIGLGYRRLLLDNNVLAGMNAFYDHEWTYNHQRVGVGGELKWRMLDFHANWYKGVSGDKTVDASTSTTEGVLDGYDFELRSQVPFLPWVDVGARRYYWNSEVSDDIKGWSYSARADITQNLSLEAGWSDDNYNSGQGFVKFVVRLARTDRPVMLSDQIVSREIFQKRDLRVHTLDKVRRENRIMVERSGGGIVIARGN